MLTREEILAMGTRLKTEVVEVPEWGGAVTVTELTSRERDAWEQSVMEMDLETEEVTSKADNARAKLILRTVIDEEGNRMFRDTDLDMLGNLSGSVMQRLFNVASKLSGLTEDDVEELAGN